jgi:pimeloyl-ACP methyl ester carboxylesterase
MEEPHNIYATKVNKLPIGDGTCSWPGWPGSQQKVTLTFQHKVSSVSFRLHSGDLSQQCFTIADNLGRTRYVSTDWGSGVDIYRTVEMDGGGIASVTVTPTFCGPGQQWDYYLDHIMFSQQSTLTFLDPVPDLLRGSEINTDSEALATGGTEVTGVAADGVARVVIRIGANYAGENWEVTLLNDLGQPSSSADEDGGLSAIQPIGPPTLPTRSVPMMRRHTSSTPLTAVPRDPSPGQVVVTAKDTLQGPKAFAVFRPPSNFSRGSADDDAPFRSVGIRIRSLDAGGATNDYQFSIYRVPIILVHGLWGAPDDWFSFSGVVDNQLLWHRMARYDDNQPPAIDHSEPPYPKSKLANVTGSSLGLSFNAPHVLDQVASAILEFRTTKKAAAAQADIVAHSMGGVVSRTLFKLQKMAGPESFAVGNVHKLITIGTPHLGTPIAQKLLDAPCVREFMATFGRFALSVAYTSEGEISGGAADLTGDGIGNNLSDAIRAIQTGSVAVPTAVIAGAMTGSNLVPGVAVFIRDYCALPIAPSGDTLAPNLNARDWPLLFDPDNNPGNSDSIVPVTSQLNVHAKGVTPSNGHIKYGIVHSAGCEGITGLGFAGPNELDPDTITGVPAKVLEWLNQVLNIGFIKLP